MYTSKHLYMPVHTPTFGESPVESVVELTDSVSKSADSITDSPVGMLSSVDSP